MISVIVPVYKSEKTLERCVNSLLAQSDRNLEILLVVDGPPDGSGLLAEKLAERDTRIRVINQENMGVSRARNRGIKEARGEYIRFVDSDDYVSKDSNEVMLHFLQEKQCDMVIAGYHHLYFGRDILKNPERAVYALNQVEAWDKEKFLKLYLNGYLNMPWNKLYKREIVGEGFPVDLNLGEDLCFNEDCILKAEKIGVLDYPVCNYIQDDRGTTLSTRKRMDKIPIAFRLFKKSTEFFEKLQLPDGNMPATKVVMEFLDDLESLAFDREMNAGEKREVIHQYENALEQLGDKGNTPRLSLLDYRIIFWFYKRKRTKAVYLLIHLRGWIVTLLKKRG